MMGHYTYEGMYVSVRILCARLCEERAHHVQISRYAAACAADHRVAFPDLLNIKAEGGQLQHTKLCLLSSKTNRTVLKWLKAHVYSIANVNYRFR